MAKRKLRAMAGQEKEALWELSAYESGEMSIIWAILEQGKMPFGDLWRCPPGRPEKRNTHGPSAAGQYTTANGAQSLAEPDPPTARQSVKAPGKTPPVAWGFGKAPNFLSRPGGRSL